ncbi:hypothetical protein B0T13DRAFT_447249 [Neurospora crassa]|nr:hypothetical protein B0T13DRAFT_447249 [Neurospora crassa]
MSVGRRPEIRDITYLPSSWKQVSLLVQELNVVPGLLWQQQQQQCNPGSDRIPQFGPCKPGSKVPAIPEQPDEDLEFIPLHRTTLLKKLDCPTQTTSSKATYFFRNIERKTAPVKRTSPPPAYAADDGRNFSAIEE